MLTILCPHGGRPYALMIYQTGVKFLNIQALVISRWVGIRTLNLRSHIIRDLHLPTIIMEARHMGHTQEQLQHMFKDKRLLTMSI